MKTPTLQTLALLGLCATFAFPAWAAPRGSNTYTLPAETFGSAGGHATSATYLHDGELDMLGAAVGSASYTQTSGFSGGSLDSTTPTLVLPVSPLVEATGPGGANVTFTLTAGDDEDGALTPTATPASGSLFAIGDTVVNVEVTDTAGNPATASFIVRVRDTTAPVVTPPADLIVAATSAAGSQVNFSDATATDAVGVTSLTSSRSSGTTFPIGTTMVTASAQDFANNVGTGAFTVTVSATIVALPAASGAAVEYAGVPGSGVPAGAVWKLFGIPGLDHGVDGLDGGVPVFLGTFRSPMGDGPGSLVQTGVFGFGGATPLLAKTGDVAPDTDGATLLAFREPIGNGGTAFIGKLERGSGSSEKTIAANEYGLWSNAFSDTDGALHLVARTGAVAPGLDLRYTALNEIALNDGRNLFWNATLSGPAANNRALFTQSSLATPAQVVLQKGQRFPDGAVVRSFLALHSGGSLGDSLPGGSAGLGTGRPNGGATTPVHVTFTDLTVGVANVGAGVLDLLARTNRPAPDLRAAWKTLGLPAAGGSAIAFRAILKAVPGSTDVTAKNAAALYSQSPGRPLAAFARQGDLAPGFEPLTYAAFSDPVLNSIGDVLYFATLAGPGVTTANREVLFVALHDAGGIAVVQRIGEEAPELPGVILAAFTGAALPQSFGAKDPRGPVFTALLKSGEVAVKATDNSGLFAVDGTGELRLLARTGSQINGKTLKTIGVFSYVLGSPVQARATSASPHVIYRATFTDLSQALVKMPVP